MKKIFSKLTIFFCLILFSCLKDNIPLSNVREDYTGEELRIDGFYYQKTSEGYINTPLYFFYRNGITFKLNFNLENINNPVDCIPELTNERIEAHRKRKYNWGIFKINKNEFLREEWSPPINGNYVHTILQTGEILSDTCFIFTKFISLKTGTLNSNVLWHFYPFSPKPDSTNVFIK